MVLNNIRKTFFWNSLTQDRTIICQTIYVSNFFSWYIRAIERFCNDYPKANDDIHIWPITVNANRLVNQSELEQKHTCLPACGKTCNCAKRGEMHLSQVTVGFDFTCWLVEKSVFALIGWRFTSFWRIL